MAIRGSGWKWVFSAFAVAALALAAWKLLLPRTRASRDPARVLRGDLILGVEVTGELAAVRSIEIGPPAVTNMWDFKISFLVPESAEVKRGQPLIGFDTAQVEKELEQKTAEFAEATKQIERKEVDLNLQLQNLDLLLAEARARLRKARLQEEVPPELVKRIEARQAALATSDAAEEVRSLETKVRATRISGEADLESLRGRRERARSRVEQLQRGLRDMTVRAPQDGIVIYKAGWRQEKLKVGDATWAGETVLQLPDLSAMKAEGEVDEADAGRVAVGQKATIRLEARPDLDYTGRVRSIGKTVQRQSRRIPTKVYRLEIALDRTDPAIMRPAMRFRAEIETGRIPGLLLAPREAIFLRTTGPVAWVKRGGRFVETPVKLGRSNKGQVEIVEGPGEGDLLSTVDLRRPERPRAEAPLGGPS